MFELEAKGGSSYTSADPLTSEVQEKLYDMEADLVKVRRAVDDRLRMFEHTLQQRIHEEVSLNVDHLKPVARDAAKEGLLDQWQALSGTMSNNLDDRFRQLRAQADGTSALTIDLNGQLLQVADQLRADLSQHQQQVHQEVADLREHHLKQQDWKESMMQSMENTAESLERRLAKVQAGILDPLQDFRRELSETTKQVEQRLRLEIAHQVSHALDQLPTPAVAPDTSQLELQTTCVANEVKQLKQALAQLATDLDHRLGTTAEDVTSAAATLQTRSETQHSQLNAAIVALQEETKRTKRECQALREELVEAASAMDRLGHDVQDRLSDMSKLTKESHRTAQQAAATAQEHHGQVMVIKDALQTRVQKAGEEVGRVWTEAKGLGQSQEELRLRMDRLDSRAVVTPNELHAALQTLKADVLAPMPSLDLVHSVQASTRECSQQLKTLQNSIRDQRTALEMSISELGSTVAGHHQQQSSMEERLHTQQTLLLPELRDACTHLKAQCKGMEAKIDDLKGLKQCVVELTARPVADCTKRELEDCEARLLRSLDSVTHQCKELQSEAHKPTEQLQSHAKRMDDLRAAISEINTTLHHQSTTGEQKLKDHIEALRIELTAHTKQATQSASERSARDTVATLNDELAATKLQMQEIRGELRQEMLQTITTLQQRVDHLQTREASNLQSSDTKLAELHQSLSSLHSASHTLDTSTTHLKGELDRLRTEMALLCPLETMNRELASCRTHLTAHIERVHTTLRDSLVGLASSTDLLALRGAVEEVRAEMAQMQKTLRALATQQAEGHQSCRTHIASLSTQTTEMAQQLGAATRHTTNGEAQVEQLRKQWDLTVQESRHFRSETTEALATLHTSIETQRQTVVEHVRGLVDQRAQTIRHDWVVCMKGVERRAYLLDRAMQEVKAEAELAQQTLKGIKEHQDQQFTGLSKRYSELRARTETSLSCQEQLTRRFNTFEMETDVPRLEQRLNSLDTFCHRLQSDHRKQASEISRVLDDLQHAIRNIKAEGLEVTALATDLHTLKAAVDSERNLYHGLKSELLWVRQSLLTMQLCEDTQSQGSVLTLMEDGVHTEDTEEGPMTPPHTVPQLTMTDPPPSDTESQCGTSDQLIATVQSGLSSLAGLMAQTYERLHTQLPEPQEAGDV
eukprot:NODE_40_length_3858_cov_45.486197_g37_i0.p1 GENE.NODE_40_length_3858_cov_45.486197_g37_i0~~NODE_40_length_3858_cov_45.486197_g37_i0.p1  ORF type:complete len:1268 (-),score=338.42 NODE_40_length_3858_cov_45.486197_g37_i0:55-3504(-)